jgi:hypothetical protein
MEATMIYANLLLLKAFGLFGEFPSRIQKRWDHERERGDIPGWVMIAIMSAAVVVVLIPLVGSKIGGAFSSAVDSVSGTSSNSGK